MVVESPRDPSMPPSEISREQYALSVFDTGMRTDFSPGAATASCLPALESGLAVELVLSCPFHGTARQIASSRRVQSPSDLEQEILSAAEGGCRITGIRVAGVMVVLDRAGVAYAQALVGGEVKYYRCGQGQGLAALLSSI